MPPLEDFVSMVRKRSEENRSAFVALDHTPQVQTSLLRIELDSMIRVFHILSYSPTERVSAIEKFYSAQMFVNAKGKRITDAHMVDEAAKFEGWTRYVYDFACAFVHLSPLHLNDLDVDLSPYFDGEAAKVAYYLNHYHGFDETIPITIRNLRPYLSRIFDKIHGNTECYLEYLEMGLEPQKAL
jgi:hypothetical protein